MVTAIFSRRSTTTDLLLARRDQEAALILREERAGGDGGTLLARHGLEAGTPEYEQARAVLMESSSLSASSKAKSLSQALEQRDRRAALKSLAAAATGSGGLTRASLKQAGERFLPEPLEEADVDEMMRVVLGSDRRDAASATVEDVMRLLYPPAGATTASVNDV